MNTQKYLSQKGCSYPEEESPKEEEEEVPNTHTKKNNEGLNKGDAFITGSKRSSVSQGLCCMMHVSCVKRSTQKQSFKQLIPDF